METPTRGRPSKFTPQLADEIVQRISEGEPLAQICRSDGIPALRTVYDWMDADADFSARIARARIAGYDQIANEALSIADTSLPISEEIQRAKLRVETRLKLLAKWDPKRYGEKVSTEISGPDGAPVYVVQRTIVDPQAPK